MHNYKSLKIWKDAMSLVCEVYETTRMFPEAEKYGIVSQMTRAAVSVPSNIAEGAGRDTDKDFVHFLSIAVGSLFELNTQIILCEQIKYITEEKSLSLQNEISLLESRIVNLKKKIADKSAERL